MAISTLLILLKKGLCDVLWMKIHNFGGKYLKQNVAIYPKYFMQNFSNLFCILFDDFVTNEQRFYQYYGQIKKAAYQT